MVVYETTGEKSVVRIHDDYFEQKDTLQERMQRISNLILGSYKAKFSNPELQKS